MPQYEGLVASLKGNGRAEVIIRPGKQSIPSTPVVREEVCRCVRDGSTITVEALNRAGAGVGDWVRVSRSVSVVRKNVVTLLGAPLAGLALGVVAGVILGQAPVLHSAGAVVVAAGGLLVGITVGTLRYRRMSADNPPIITRIIKPRPEMSASLAGK